jgi:hypothetical protein
MVISRCWPCSNRSTQTPTGSTGQGRARRGGFRRYGSELYPYFGIMTFNAYGLEIIATPLAMTGAYTGGSAFGRFLETSRLWTDTTEPGATRPGGVGRRSAIMVRVLHSIIRHTMLPHAKWDRDRLGMPISQFGMLGTLLLSSFAPVNS